MSSELKKPAKTTSDATHFFAVSTRAKQVWKVDPLNGSRPIKNENTFPPKQAKMVDRLKTRRILLSKLNE